MLDKLRHPRARRVFLLLCMVAALLSSLANLGINRLLVPEYRAACSTGVVPSPATEPNGHKTTSGQQNCPLWLAFVAEIGPGITVEFVSAFLIAGFFIWILTLLREEEAAVADVDVLFEPHQRLSHLDALKHTTFWYHDGHLASWVRRYVLPEFKERCQRTIATCHIRAAILDPSNSEVCQTYLRHVMSLQREEQRVSTLIDLRVELCSTICIFVLERMADHLDIDLYLKSDIDFIRDDITNIRAFWTTVGKGKPAIALQNRPSSTFYHLAVRNFATAARRYRKVDLDAASHAYNAELEATEPQRVMALMQAIFPTAGDLWQMEFCEKVVKNCGKGSP